MDHSLLERQTTIENKVKKVDNLQIRFQESLKNSKTRQKELLIKIKERTGKGSSKMFIKYVKDLETQMIALMDEAETVLEQFEDQSSEGFDDEDYEDDDDFDL